MAEQPILNTDLEQAVYRAALREKKLRRQATATILVPILVGGLWLFYSASEVIKWHGHANAVEDREAGIAQRESESRRLVAESEAQRKEWETRANSVAEGEKTAKAAAADIQQRLIKVRDEIGALGLVLTELSSARLKASKLGASEAVESQLVDIRSTLSRTLGRIEQQIDVALPVAEQRARVFLFIADEEQRQTASRLKVQLETNGFDVAGISKSVGRRVDEHEVRYFRDPQDKAEAARILAILDKQLGESGAKVAFASDPDHASGSKKFQVWLGKPGARTVR